MSYKSLHVNRGTFGALTLSLKLISLPASSASAFFHPAVFALVSSPKKQTVLAAKAKAKE